jgi:hypothetical protein
MEDKWMLIDDAPLEVPGIFWSPEVSRRWDLDPTWHGEYPTGHVKKSERTGARKAIASWSGTEFTHFHPNPPPPHA